MYRDKCYHYNTTPPHTQFVSSCPFNIGFISKYLMIRTKITVFLHREGDGEIESLDQL